jgi:hypothetical protein
MKRQISNLLFLFGFMLALVIGRTNYVQFGRSLLTDVYSKLYAVSKTYKEGQVVTEQNNYNKTLPNIAFIKAHQSFMEGEYINKDYITQRVAGLANDPGITITATTNHGRDGP